jgi:fibro-slime domain-containing protein
MTMRKFLYAWALLALACNSDASDRESSFDTTGSSTGTESTTGDVTTVGTSGTSGAGGAGIMVMPPDASDAGNMQDGPTIITTLPAGFTAAEIGGWRLGAALGDGSDAGASDPGGNMTNCANILRGVVRDFKGRETEMGHLDFQGPLYGNGITVGLVNAMLGPDQKPVYASQCEEGHPMPAPTCPFQAETTTQANFDQWYRYTPGINKPYIVELWFAPQPNGLFTFKSPVFFPIDGAGWGNTPGQAHNFSFTTELHTLFSYHGGETFTFDGDDDVWVFVNGHLAVDLGGLHPKASFTLVLDTAATQLGIQIGSTYSLDLFHAERHTNDSNFRIDTNLAFVNCGSLPPDVVR